jgi:hypothetical protein
MVSLIALPILVSLTLDSRLADILDNANSNFSYEKRINNVLFGNHETFNVYSQSATERHAVMGISPARDVKRLPSLNIIN